MCRLHFTSVTSVGLLQTEGRRVVVLREVYCKGLLIMIHGMVHRVAMQEICHVRLVEHVTLII